MTEGSTELFPTEGITKALEGVISEPIKTVSYKPGEKGKTIEVKLALEGPGMFSLADWEDNAKWSGIFNHPILCIRFALYWGEKMRRRGTEVNSQLILDGGIVSHDGRRQWDEACWYPEVAPNADEKRSIPNEILGIRLIEGKVPEPVLQFVKSLAFSKDIDPSFYQSWEHRLFILADHRTSDKYLPLHVRMGDFIWTNFFNKNQVESVKSKQVRNKLGELFEKERRYHLNQAGEKGITIDEAVDEMHHLGANLASPRSTLRLQLENLLADVRTEADLKLAGIDPDKINNRIVPMPKWEHKLRWQYVDAAKESIVKRLSDLNIALKNEWSPTVFRLILRGIHDDFYTDWWGEYARSVYEASFSEQNVL